jgi:hypothetical protein
MVRLWLSSLRGGCRDHLPDDGQAGFVGVSILPLKGEGGPKDRMGYCWANGLPTCPLRVHPALRGGIQSLAFIHIGSAEQMENDSRTLHRSTGKRLRWRDGDALPAVQGGFGGVKARQKFNTATLAFYPHPP